MPIYWPKFWLRELTKEDKIYQPNDDYHRDYSEWHKLYELTIDKDEIEFKVIVSKDIINHLYDQTNQGLIKRSDPRFYE